MPKVIEIQLSTKITKSHKYQSGTGEWGIVAQLFDDEGYIEAYDELREKVVELANQLANEALEKALEGKR